MFDYWIAGPLRNEQPEGLRRLRRLVASSCLQRTKTSIWDELKIPPRIEKEHLVSLDQKDRELYEFFRSKISSFVSGAFSDNSTGSSHPSGHILPLINTLRLICNHGESLVPLRMQQAWSQQFVSENFQGRIENGLTNCDSCNIEVSSDGVFSEFGCIHVLCNSCTNADDGKTSSAHQIACPICTETQSGTDMMLQGSTYEPSAKVKALIANLREEQRLNSIGTNEKPVKSVVFTFWTRMLDLLENALLQSGFSFTRVDGQKSSSQRASALSEFDEVGNCTVMIATIGSVSEGVDLTAANYIHLMEPHWNPMLEAQALDRVHRMGQRRDVVATRYIVPYSIEGYVQDVKEKKLQLVNKSLGGGGATADEIRLDWKKHLLNYLE
ncbi:P-loop containing nucleoside triphosphate hydrolase protein [Hypoxylon trugodes]|uniref:P-loop containing nucleoside triphosphate hydrolase protein n=1 Tax=Hypoxylon trugodes TaxID=326681 RepID=UPI00219CA3BA|nr:P-loop containing nucleoside triphosphate hydrolase protein [Hypoxylon trugodes]KAI1389345.1 P-loop containing nucleoside triphosphate hydrolase protein [Hypoxylon trugodes]